MPLHCSFFNSMNTFLLFMCRVSILSFMLTYSKSVISFNSQLSIYFDDALCHTVKYIHSHIHTTEIFQFFSSFHVGVFSFYIVGQQIDWPLIHWVKSEHTKKAMTIPRIGQLLLFLVFLSLSLLCVCFFFLFFDLFSFVRQNNNSLEFWIVLINHNQFIHIISHVKRTDFIPKKLHSR